MARLQVTVPFSAPANALLRVRLPDGQEVKVRVPEGLKPGDEFQFEVSSLGEIKSSIPSKKGGSTQSSSERSKHSTSKNPKKKKSNQSDSSTKGNSHQNRTPVFVQVCLDLYQKIYQSLMEEDDVPATTTTTTTITTAATNKTNQKTQFNTSNEQRVDLRQPKKSTLSYLEFLDREIVNGKDFFTALAVGMFIGLSIVMGFLAGVLWVTPVE